MSRISLFLLAIGIATLGTFIPNQTNAITYAVERPVFSAPVSGQTYTSIPEVRWTNVPDATEYQVLVQCKGCLNAAPFFPMTYQFTVHQAYLDFSYDELKRFLQKHRITPDEKVNITLHVRAKAHGEFSDWSNAKQFYAKEDARTTPRPKIRQYTQVHSDNTVTVYGYLNRNVERMQISLRGNTEYCYNTSICVLRNAGPFAPGSIVRGIIAESDTGAGSHTDVRVEIPGVVEGPVKATIEARQRNNGSIIFYNHTVDNVIVDTIEVFVNGNMVRRCHNNYYCAYTGSGYNTNNPISYSVRTVHNGHVYQTDTFNVYDAIGPTITTSFEHRENGNIVVYFGSKDTSGVRIMEVFVNDVKKTVCYHAECEYFTESYNTPTQLRIKVRAIDNNGNASEKVFTVTTRVTPSTPVPTQRIYEDPDKDGHGTPNKYIYIPENAVVPDGYVARGIRNYKDNCPNTYNPNQLDTDDDGTGDVCDSTPTGPVVDTTSTATEPVPVNVQIRETVYNGKNVIEFTAKTKDAVVVDRLNILVNARIGAECKDTNECVARIDRSKIIRSFTYGVNSYLDGQRRYWSGYKGKRL